MPKLSVHIAGKRPSSTEKTAIALRCFDFSLTNCCNELQKAFNHVFIWFFALNNEFHDNVVDHFKAEKPSGEKLSDQLRDAQDTSLDARLLQLSFLAFTLDALFHNPAENT